MIRSGARFYGPQYLRERDRSIPQMFGIGTKATTGRSPRLQLEFLAKDSDRVILSEENFLGKLFDERGVVGMPLYSAAGDRISALSERLPHTRIRIFLALRRPDSFLNSIYSQVLFGGLTLRPESFRARNDIGVVDWPGLVRRIAEVDGVSEVCLWCHEDYPEVLPKIIDRLVGPGIGAHFKADEAIVHQGLSADAVQHVLKLAAEGKKGQLAQQARRKFPVTESSPKLLVYDEADTASAEILYYRQLQELGAMEKVHFVQGPFLEPILAT